MSLREQSRTASGRPRSAIFVGIAVGGSALVGVLGCQALATTPSPALAPPPSSAPASPSPAPSGTRVPHLARGGAPVEPELIRRHARREVDEADASAVTVFDDDEPAVANLDPALLAALREAGTDAADSGVRFVVTSGWRSAEQQERLFQEAVSEYGSEEEAARWVATPETSAHVSGDAVDIGYPDAAAWMSEHGAAYGLCQIYGNEPWHYELRPEAVDGGCPAMYTDPTQDPRMQR